MLDCAGDNYAVMVGLSDKYMRLDREVRSHREGKTIFQFKISTCLVRVAPAESPFIQNVGFGKGWMRVDRGVLYQRCIGSEGLFQSVDTRQFLVIHLHQAGCFC